MSDETQVLDLLKETRRNLNAGKVVFGRFELERELGSGGMGVVWLAKDNDVEGRVALKFLPGLVRDPVAERDLRDEVKNARDLVHENIVNVRTLHKDESSIAVEMEFVDGPSVSRLIAESPNCWLDPEGAASIVRGLCLAIAYAWQPPRKLVHRDVKPLNLLLNSAGVAKVVDFGIAHSVSETVARLTNLAAAKRVVGSLPYMSPQQLRGEIHHLNDVYSIGATIFELLTGTPPFRAKDVATLTSQINHDLPTSMTERRWQLIEEKNRTVIGKVPLPKDWEEVVAACLEKDSAKRPKDARDIAVRLGLVSENKTKVPFPGRDGSGDRGKKRRQPLILGTAAVLVVGAGLTAWMFRDRLSPKGPPPPTPAVVVDQPKAIPLPEGKQTMAPPETEKGPKADAKETTPAPAKPLAQSQPPLAQPPAPPRKEWHLVATAPVRLAVSDSGGTVLYEGSMTAGEKRPFPVEKPLLVEVREGGGLSLEIDGKPMPPPPVASNRWIMNIPAPADAMPKLSEAPPPPPPFETEVGPLVKSGQVNKIESDWLRAALGRKKGEEERALAAKLFEKPPLITLMQWRAQTSLEFKPTREAITSADPALMARAIDLVLPPGKATMRLLRIEPGTFNRGSPADELGRRPNEAVSPATIPKAFFMGKFEVTQMQFESVMPRNPSAWRSNPTWPVDQVTWNDLFGKGPKGFIAKLNDELAKDSGNVLVADLPRDDEWEYACRAGTTTAFNSGVAITSKNIDLVLAELAVYGRPSGSGPQPVGTKKPNAWGLYDMHGNIQEWTQSTDSASSYARGGSWESSATYCRAAARNTMHRDATGSKLTGFRLVIRTR